MEMVDGGVKRQQLVVVDLGQTSATVDLAKSMPVENEEYSVKSMDGFSKSLQMIVGKQSEELSTSPIVTLPEPYYFQVNELTERPNVLLDISPDLAFFLPNGLSQVAILRLLINEYGDIDQVAIENSVLSAQTQDLVRDAFAKIKFSPGKINEVPVKSQLKIEVILEGADKPILESIK